MGIASSSGTIDQDSLASGSESIISEIGGIISGIGDVIEAGLIRAYKIVVQDLIVGKILAGKIAAEDSIISKGITKFVHLIKGGVDAITGAEDQYEGELDKYEGDEFVLGDEEKGYISCSVFRKT